jgi:hypothetical protein
VIFGLCVHPFLFSPAVLFSFSLNAMSGMDQNYWPGLCNIRPFSFLLWINPHSCIVLSLIFEFMTYVV